MSDRGGSSEPLMTQAEGGDPHPPAGPEHGDFGHENDQTLRPPTESRPPHRNGSDIAPPIADGDTLVFTSSATSPARDETLSLVGRQAPSPADQTLQWTGESPRGDSGDAFTDDEGSSASESDAEVTRFGKYELVSMIAKGGMGVVYKARDTKLNRTVALKMILSGNFAEDGEIARFYAEAKAAAMLRHPNIVAIFDYGEVDERPFFAMDYIEGGGLSDLVRENALSPAKAAALVKTVAEAMHHAHEKGILHRDLKPSNVLLDHAGEPMITDFGLAKQVEGQSQLTVSGTILGTPSYMPPEQAAGRVEDVAVPSDVYSIGAILYELLTGRPPFRAANAVETLKQVLDAEPVSPRLLNPSLPVDIETICLKCLQKEPAARYASAQELADELERFLAGEPILARPIGRAARLWRWCRRKPKIAALAATALVGAVIAVTSITVGYFVTSSALQRAEQSLDQLLGAIQDLYMVVADNDLLNSPGMQPTRRLLLEKARDLYQEILEQQGEHPEVRQDLALSYFSLGRIMQDLDRPEEALAPLRQARTMQEALLKQARTEDGLAALGDTLNLTGEVLEKVGRLEKARSLFHQTTDIRASLAKQAPANAEYGRKLANAYMNSGHIWRAIASGLGEGPRRDAAFERALGWYQKAQSKRQVLLKEFPNDAKLRLDLAMGYFSLARVVTELAPALESLQEAIVQFDLLLDADQENLECNFLRAQCNVCIGDLISFSEQPEPAEAHYDEAIDRLTKLVLKNEEVHTYKAELAAALINRGYLLSTLRNNEAAIESFVHAKDILEPLVEGFPKVQAYRHNLDAVTDAIASIKPQ
jgi:tetratricopeptide (TPR) repeat protein/tRNA A-37 threonylcarbamoyl transferase component Bud32